MKQKITLLLVMVLFGVFNLHAQTQFWSDTFEDAGAPSNGTRSPENESSTGSPATAYFFRTNNAGIQTMFSPGGYLNLEGAKFWAGEDHDTPLGGGQEEQEINWTGINVSGKTGLSFRGYFAANNINAAFENANGSLGGSHTDYVIVEYRFNGAGAYTRLLAFFANNATSPGTDNKALALDTDGDSVGNTPILSGTFADIQGNIVGTGNTLDIRIRAYSNGTNEEWAIDNFRLFETPACVAPTITAQPANRSICNNANTTFAVTATGATGYQWQVNTGSGFTDITNGGVYSTATTNTLTITGATSGMSGYLYRCVTYNGPLTCFTNSNSATLTISVPSLTNASQTNIACNGGSNGAAQVNAATGGIGPYTYNWTPGNPTGDGTTNVSGLTAGTWTCTVTDAIGCTASTNFTITQPTALVLNASSQTNIACNGGSTGAAAVNAATGGAGGYTYNWTPGNPTGDGTTSVTGLTAGTWTCTVTDANGCTAARNFTITQPPSLSLTASSQTNIACNGGSTGAAAVNAATGGAGGYTYNWTPGNPTGDGTTSVTGLTAGTWTCTVTDANACTTAINFTITQPTSLVLNANTQTNISCNGGSNGSASVNTATGGAGGYTYNWTPGNPTGDGTTSVSGLSAGTWTCTVTDANGCTTARNFTITQPTALLSSAASQTNVSCNGGSNGSASINTPTGGAGGYTYNWTPGNPTGDGTTSVFGLSPGTWTCTVTDANSCTTAVNFTITQPTALSATAASQTNVSCNGGSNGAASINPVSGGAGGYTYNWTPGNPTGDGTTSVTGLTAGTWTCTITDANSCTTDVNFTITQPTAVDASVTQSAGILTATQNGATYQWYSCPNTLLTGETNQTYTPSIVGDYKAEITFGGCTVTSSCITVTTLDTDDFNLFDKFKMYPNPNNGSLTIETETDGNFVIVNQLGQIVESFTAKANARTTINIEKLSDGTYFVKGNKGTNIPTKKLVIKK
ncbi:T9SS type A sorting domain-containing protein [Flavobacterium sp. GCM10023249]|uniref:T9SS type A sorting domain-containing protein n=1 Tax=unclassified Flavobacterium TaxID=196869 RepID=UPI0036067006